MNISVLPIKNNHDKIKLIIRSVIIDVYCKVGSFGCIEMAF